MAQTKEEKAACKKIWRAANKVRLAAYRKAYRKANRAKIDRLHKF